MKHGILPLALALGALIPSSILMAQPRAPKVTAGMKVTYEEKSSATSISEAAMMGRVESGLQTAYTIALTAGMPHDDGVAWAGNAHGGVTEMHSRGNQIEMDTVMNDNFELHFFLKPDWTVDQFSAIGPGGTVLEQISSGEPSGVRRRTSQLFLPEAWRAQPGGASWSESMVDTVAGLQPRTKKGEMVGMAVQYIAATLNYTSDGPIDTLGAHTMRVRWTSSDIHVATQYVIEFDMPTGSINLSPSNDPPSEEFFARFGAWHSEEKRGKSIGSIDATGRIEGVSYYRLDDGMLMASTRSMTLRSVQTTGSFTSETTSSWKSETKRK